VSLCAFGGSVAIYLSGTGKSCGPYTLFWDSGSSTYKATLNPSVDPCGLSSVVFTPPNTSTPSYGSASDTNGSLSDAYSVPSMSYDCSHATMQFNCSGSCNIVGSIGGGIALVYGAVGEPTGATPPTLGNTHGQSPYIPMVVAEGTSVIVAGSGFNSTSAVTVGGVSVSFTVVNDGLLQLSIPSNGSVTSGGVIITAPGGSIAGPELKIISTAAPMIGNAPA
jgi:hypothetical protein